LLYINSVISRISILQQWFNRIIKPPHLLWNYDFPDGKAVIEIRQPFLVWLLIGLFVLYFFSPKAMVVICLVTLLGICICSFIWVRTQVVHIHAQRKLLFAAVQVGDELEENIQIINSGILPVLWIAVEDNSNFPAYSIRSVRAVDPQSKTTWRYHLTCRQRGIFTLGPWQWTTSDPFGIFYLRRSYLHTQQMVVYPPLALLPASLLPVGRQVGDLRPVNQPLAAETILATHTRPFQPGDPLRRVHWRTTARRGSPYVKIFDPEAASRVWLIPDLDANVHSNPSIENDDWQDSSEENMILLLSALASQLLNDHRAVGLFAGSGTDRIVLPQRGPAHFWTILAALTPLHATHSQSFDRTLQQASTLISARDLIIAVTPSLEVDWMITLARLTHVFGGNSAWSFLLDPLSFGMSGEAQLAQESALEMGITTRIIRRGDILMQTGGMGVLRRWEFKTLGTGKVVVRNAPRQVSDWPEMSVKKW